jgi:spore maturation protein CgeB
VRIAVVDTYYREFLRRHYRDRPELARASYDKQLKSLLDTLFGTSDAYTSHLRALGHDARNLIANARELQGAWAREHGLGAWTHAQVPGTRLPLAYGLQMALLRRVALAQIAEQDSDAVFVHGLASLPRHALDRLRAEGRFLVGQIASPLPARDVIKGYDLILSSFPHFVERFRAMGIESLPFHLAFYDHVLERLRERGVDPAPESAQRSGVVFVGSVHPKIHPEGVALLERLCAAIDVDVWGYGADALPAGSPILRCYHGEAWGTDMYQVLARASIVVNRHIGVAEGVANNMRLYEATGTGALLATEAAPNLAELFEPGREVVTYESADDLVAKVQAHLSDDAKRIQIAAAGQRRTLAEHTYAVRMRELASVLEARISSNQAR